MRKPKIVLMLIPIGREVEVELDFLPESGDTVHYGKVDFKVDSKKFVFDLNIIRIWCHKI